jgi:RNA polymerase sigma-70 factor (ECF subfamily)
MGISASCEASREKDHLLHLALGGDREALDQLFAIFMRPMYKVALRFVRSPQDAEDALQDGLLAASQNLKKFEGRSCFSTWLTRIVVNASLMQLRRKRSRIAISIKRDPLEREEPPLTAQIVDTRLNPEETCVKSELLSILKDRLQNLPAVSRSALWFRDVEGLGTRETAEVLGLTEMGVKMRLHRERRRIIKEVRQALGPRGFTGHAPSDTVLQL